MVQVGTTAFAADAWCHPATVALQGTMLAADTPQAVMDFTDGNQSQAAGILGINRGTLRKKLRTYSLIR